jgi:IclR family transcriptional regulator, mhp operon transcriptional activator
MRDYKVKRIDALHRGLLVLEVLQDMRAASLHDLHRETGIPKSTLIRIVHTLHARGMVWQRMADGAFLPSHTLQRRAPLDDADWLSEIASPVLERLCRRVPWPSVLSVPRLDYMEVIETNSPRACFDHVPPAQVGCRGNMLRSASGRAYLAFCPDQEREAVLRRLAERDLPGDELARDPAAVRRVVETTRQRGYGVRAPDFGSHDGQAPGEADDGRNSIAMPISADGQVLGCVNLTWRMSVLTVDQVVERHLEHLRAAVLAIEKRAAARPAPAAQLLPATQPMPAAQPTLAAQPASAAQPAPAAQAVPTRP